jgi:hypothetical protein
MSRGWPRRSYAAEIRVRPRHIRSPAIAPQLRLADAIRALGLCIGMLAVAGCTSALSGAPGPVRTSLQPLVDDGFVCGGPSNDASSIESQWVCDKTDSGTVLRVVLDGSESGVRQIVGQVDQANSPSSDTGPLLAFFQKLAGPLGIPATDLGPWLASHLTTGGQEHFGPVFVTLVAAKPLTHLSLFVESQSSG